jgi:hypothetical protein
MDIGYYLTLLFYYLIYGGIPFIVILPLVVWALDIDPSAIKDAPKYRFILVTIFFGFVMDMLGLI